MAYHIQGSRRGEYSTADTDAATASWFYEEWGFRYLSKRFGIRSDEARALMDQFGGRIEDLDRHLEDRARSAVARP